MVCNYALCMHFWSHFLIVIVTNVIDIKKIQAGINEVLLLVEENSCAASTTDMCIILHYWTNSSNYTKSVRRYRSVIESGILKLENLMDDTEYKFQLMIVNNCNNSDVFVGWKINGSFTTKGICHHSLSW